MQLVLEASKDGGVEIIINNDIYPTFRQIDEIIAYFCHLKGSTTNEIIEQHNQEIRDNWYNYSKIKRTVKSQSFPGYIYVLESKGIYKIGRTKDIKSRLSSYKTGDPDFSLVYHQKVKNQYEAEKYLHNLFQTKRYKGEWFKLDVSDISIIKKECEVLI